VESAGTRRVGFPSQIQISPNRAKSAKAKQRKSKENTLLSLDSLVRIERLQWVALTPKPLFSFAAGGGSGLTDNPSKGLRLQLSVGAVMPKPYHEFRFPERFCCENCGGGFS
jgi:hypothetical protein